MTVTNLSQKYEMRLISVSVDGIDAAFDVKESVSLAPGASYTVPLRGSIPPVSLTTADITINYALVKSVTPLGSRTLVFTLMNGAAPAYNSAAPYTRAFQKTAFDQSVPNGMTGVLERVGIFDFLKMIIKSLVTILRTFKATLMSK